MDEENTQMNPLYNEPICTEGRCHFYSIQPSLKSAEWCVVTTFDIVGLPPDCIAVYHFRMPFSVAPAIPVA